MADEYEYGNSPNGLRGGKQHRQPAATLREGARALKAECTCAVEHEGPCGDGRVVRREKSLEDRMADVERRLEEIEAAHTWVKT